MLSSVLTFTQFFVSLRVHLYTPYLRKKKSQNTSVDELFQNFISEKILSKIIFFLLVLGTFSSTKT